MRAAPVGVEDGVCAGKNRPKANSAEHTPPKVSDCCKKRRRAIEVISATPPLYTFMAAIAGKHSTLPALRRFAL